MSKILETHPAPNAEPSRAERKARAFALQSELELLDNVRDRVRNALRELVELREFSDQNPVRFRTVNALAAAAVDCLTVQSSALTVEINKLDTELTSLTNPPAGALMLPVRVDRFGEIIDEDNWTLEEMVARGDALGIVQTVLGGGR